MQRTLLLVALYGGLCPSISHLHILRVDRGVLWVHKFTVVHHKVVHIAVLRQFLIWRRPVRYDLWTTLEMSTACVGADTRLTNNVNAASIYYSKRIFMWITQRIKFKALIYLQPKSNGEINGEIRQRGREKVRVRDPHTHNSGRRKAIQIIYV